MKNNKIVLTIILVLTIGIVGLTIAYFSNSSTITNTFNTNPYGTTVTEEFVSPDNWLPGTSTDKSLTVTNTGQVDEAVRISYTESWTSRSAKNNNEEGDLPLQQNGNTAALIHFTNTDDWTTVTENGTTYRYYNYKLAPSSTTSELLDYVTFNPAITNSSNCTTTESNGTKTITCNSTGTGYDDATYKLTFNIETVQYNKYKEAWETNVNIVSMKPMNATQLALKSNPVSVTNYTDGNVHEMYTFNHDATEQTPALTDYRYIGNDPYNYIYFNCDDLNNQNSETCEVWRIIGVFDVERTDPNDNTKTITERRMKLVRGSGLSEKMQWDNRTSEDSNDIDYGKNEWEGSLIQKYLNENYYYILNNSTKNFIENAKYYLGGRTYDYSSYGTTEEIYTWERGKTVYGKNGAERSINWEGKVALIYPSDMYMTYSNGVDSVCYNNPHECREKEPWGAPKLNNPGYPQKSWIFITNRIEEDNNYENIWTISPMISESYEIFDITSLGDLAYSYNYVASHYNISRPTLYLSSSVKIIDGDGSINNPYKLSL